MMILITYDVSLRDEAGARRLRSIARCCQNYGNRVQFSVFECEVEPEMWVRLKAHLLSLYDEKTDSLRFYLLGANWKRRAEHYGAGHSPDLLHDSLVL